MNVKAKNLVEVDRMVHEGRRKPVAVVSMATYMYSDFTRAFREGFPHLAVLHEVDKALGAVARVAQLGMLPDEAPIMETVTPPRLDDLLAGAVARPDGRCVLDEAASKALLSRAGLRMPREQIARDAESAAKAAREIGFPVVLKLVSDDVQHKSDVGGVMLDLENEAAVTAAFGAIRDNLASRQPQARFGGVLVAEQVTGGLELVLGIHRDPEVGLVTMFGSGGVLLELQKDVAFGPVPLTRRQAEDMIDSTTAGRLLHGYRGSPARDRTAVVDALVAVSQLAAGLGERLESIDVNPLAALPAGCGAVALDGLVVLGSAPST
jgi:acetyltransferase